MALSTSWIMGIDVIQYALYHRTETNHCILGHVIFHEVGEFYRLGNKVTIEQAESERRPIVGCVCFVFAASAPRGVECYRNGDCVLDCNLHFARDWEFGHLRNNRGEVLGAGGRMGSLVQESTFAHSWSGVDDNQRGVDFAGIHFSKLCLFQDRKSV